MLIDELKVPFRWYTNAHLSTRTRKECRGYRYKLITPKDRLLPFMHRFPTPANPSNPLHWKIKNADTDALVVAIDDNITATSIDYYRFNGWDYLIYKGSSEIPGLDLATGFYYAEIEMEDGTLHTSEVFWVDCDLDGNTLSGDFSDDFNNDFSGQFSDAGVLQGLKKYTKLTWWHPCDIGIMLYQTGYVNMLYIEAEMIKGEAEILEEGKEDGNKDFVPTFVKLTDNISFSDYVPEHIVNALMGIPVHANAYVTTKDKQYVGKAKRFTLTFDSPYLCHTKVEGKFQMETTLLRSQCCSNNAIVNLYNQACEVVISNLDVQNGDTFLDHRATWQVDSGVPSGYEIRRTPNADQQWVDVGNVTQYDFRAPVLLTFFVRPYCILGNGRKSYGNTLTFTSTG